MLRQEKEKWTNRSDVEEGETIAEAIVVES
jgi:hypothetical protein